MGLQDGAWWWLLTYLMTDYEEKGNYNFDYNRVLGAFGLVYSAAIVLPIILFFLTVCMGMKMTVQNLSKFLTIWLIRSNFTFHLRIFELVPDVRVLPVDHPHIHRTVGRHGSCWGLGHLFPHADDEEFLGSYQRTVPSHCTYHSSHSSRTRLSSL